MNRFDPLRKLLHADEAVARYASQPATVFTDGVFDLLQRGHIAWLAEARQLGIRTDDVTELVRQRDEILQPEEL